MHKLSAFKFLTVNTQRAVFVGSSRTTQIRCSARKSDTDWRAGQSRTKKTAQRPGGRNAGGHGSTHTVS